MTRSRVFLPTLFSALCFSMAFASAARADDVLTIAQPEDVRAFDAAVSKKLGKNPGQKKPILNSSATPAPQLAGTSPKPVPQTEASSAEPAQTNSREELLKNLIRSLQDLDSVAFKNLLTPAYQAKLSLTATMNHLHDLITEHQDFRLANEALVHSVPGKDANGKSRPILELYSAEIQAKDSSGQVVKLIRTKTLCGSKPSAETQDSDGREKCVFEELTAE